MNHNDYLSCHNIKNYKHDKSILKCGNIRAITVPSGSTGGIGVIPVPPPPPPEPIIDIVEATYGIISHVCVKVPCCSRPCTKIEFSSNIITTGFMGILSFHISKLCDNQLIPTILTPNWNYSRIGDTSSTTFSFFTCDCDICSNTNCTYFVRAAVVGTATIGTAQINNASISALTTCQDCQ